MYYHDSAGRLRTLPITWTSLISPDPVVIFGAARAPFKLADVLEHPLEGVFLARLVETLRTGKRDKQLQPPPSAEGHRGVK